MASTYSTNLALELIATGEQAGTWGTTTNTNIGTLLEQAISGYVTQAITDGADTTITIPNGATGVARNMAIEMTGALTAARNLVVPANKKLYLIYNNTTGGYAVTVKVSGQTGVSVPNGKKMLLVSNGTDIVVAENYMAGNISGTAANVTGTVATGNGGTGRTDATPGNGYLLIGNGSGYSLATITQGSGITVTNGAGSITIAATGGGGGSGTVTSVDVSGGSTGLSFSGGPITTTGTITMSGTLGKANGGTGLSSTPTNGQLLIGNGTGYSLATLSAGTGISITNGAGTIQITSTATGTGTVTSVNVSGGSTGLSFSGGPITSSGTITAAGTLGLGYGGTAATTASGARSNILNSYTGNALKVLRVNSGATDTEWASVAGDVTGPGSSTSGNVTTFSGTTGKVIQDAGVAFSKIFRHNGSYTSGSVFFSTSAPSTEGSNGDIWFQY